MEYIKTAHRVYHLQYHVVWVSKEHRLILNPGMGRRLIAHCKVETDRYAGALSTEIPDWLILIGPEGDFTDGEISRAREEQFIEISLGDAVFRTETAGMVACQIIAGLYRQSKTD